MQQSIGSAQTYNVSASLWPDLAPERPGMVSEMRLPDELHRTLGYLAEPTGRPKSQTVLSDGYLAGRTVRTM